MNSYYQATEFFPMIQQSHRQVLNFSGDTAFQVFRFEDFFTAFPEYFFHQSLLQAHCFLLVRCGIVQLKINDSHEVIQDSSLFYLPPGSLLHIERTTDLRAEVILFPAALLQTGRFSNLMLNDFAIFSQLTGLWNMRLEDFEFTEIDRMIARLHGELVEEQTLRSAEYLHNVFVSLLFIFERLKRSTVTATTEPSRDAAKAEQFVQLLEEHYMQERAVQFYADALHVTPRKLNVVVSAKYNISVKRVIEKRVIEGIKCRLRNTDDTLKEIGYAFGFKDPTNFNKYFKKYTRLTPATYKRKYIMHI